MKIEFPAITEGNVNNQILELLQQTIIDYFSPMSYIAKNNVNTLGGSSTAEYDVLNAYINGIHDWLEGAFQPLVQEWLDINRYDGYTAVVTIPEPEADTTSSNIQKALAGDSTESLLPNEIRALLDEEELDEAGLKKLAEYYAGRKQAAPAGIPGFSYQPGELKALQQKGVITPHANTFRGAGTGRGDGEPDIKLLAAPETDAANYTEPVAWITVNGSHIPLFKGDTKESAIARREATFKMFGRDVTGENFVMMAQAGKNVVEIPGKGAASFSREEGKIRIDFIGSTAAGTGTQMIQRIESIVRQEGMKTLVTSPTDAGEAFWRHAGFHRVDSVDWEKDLTEPQKNDTRKTVQDDIADMFNEELPGGTYQRTVADINQAIDALSDDLMTIIKEKGKT